MHSISLALTVRVEASRNMQRGNREAYAPGGSTGSETELRTLHRRILSFISLRCFVIVIT
jgi:hypothetical protein